LVLKEKVVAIIRIWCCFSAFWECSPVECDWRCPRHRWRYCLYPVWFFLLYSVSFSINIVLCYSLGSVFSACL